MVLVGLTGCTTVEWDEQGAVAEAAEGFPDRRLDADELEALLPVDDDVPAGLEAQPEHFEQTVEDVTPEEWSDRISDQIEALEELRDLVDEHAAEVPDVEACHDLIDEYISHLEEREDAVLEDPPADEQVDVSGAYMDDDGTPIAINLSTDASTSFSPEEASERAVTCGVHAGGELLLPSDLEEISLGEASGFQHEEVVMMWRDFGYTRVQAFIVPYAEPLEDSEALISSTGEIIEHIEEELAALADADS